MAPDVRLGDGVTVTLGDGRRIVADASDPGASAVVLSHAHGDHLFAVDAGPVVCSPLTAALAEVRRDGRVERTTAPYVDLRPAGHVPGSRAAVVRGDEATVCYTGDVSTRDRFYLEGFDPPDADVLVVEATYGTPAYTFPPQADVEAAVVDWLEETSDRPVLLFGYALGRAQELELLAERAGRRVLVSDAIAALDRAIAEHLDVTVPGERYDAVGDVGAGDALVLPTGLATRGFVDRLREGADALTAGFSGWAVDESFEYRGGYDRTFVLSDHCDFEELVALVDAVDPDRVYTQHGFADAFARELTTRGYDARALKRDQATLGDF